MRDHMLGWPAALDYIDAPSEYVRAKRTPVRERPTPQAEAEARAQDRKLTAALALRELQTWLDTLDAPTLAAGDLSGITDLMRGTPRIAHVDRPDVGMEVAPVPKPVFVWTKAKPLRSGYYIASSLRAQGVLRWFDADTGVWSKAAKVGSKTGPELMHLTKRSPNPGRVEWLRPALPHEVPPEGFENPRL